MFIKKKPVDDTKLTFAKMGSKPVKKNAKNTSNSTAAKSKQTTKGKGANFWSKKAAVTLSKGK
jgi:hypothetical protein